MDTNQHFFTVWTHRSARSIFGAASHPVIRNGELLCFASEERAQVECDRLNAASGGSHVHYTVKPAHVRHLSPTNGLEILDEAFRRASRGLSGKPLLAQRSPDTTLCGRVLPPDWAVRSRRGNCRVGRADS
jgi:hypothetical protein